LTKRNPKTSLGRVRKSMTGDGRKNHKKGSAFRAVLDSFPK